MRIEKTRLAGCCLIYNDYFRDARGYFFESFNQKEFCEKIGEQVNFVQDNESSSKRGVLRGLHFQDGEFTQAKLVRVLQGRVLDVAVDLREESKTFGEYVAIELSESSQCQLFIPRGFAHGFFVLSEEARFFYKCDNYYDKSSEKGIIYNDPDIGINWRCKSDTILLSEKDKNLPTIKQIKKQINFFL